MKGWFGAAPFARKCLMTVRYEAPVGHPCLHCDEAIGPQDEGLIVNHFDDGEQPIHRECLIRSVAGSVGHQKKTCSCFGGPFCDPPGHTKREAAIVACTYFDGITNPVLSKHYNRDLTEEEIAELFDLSKRRAAPSYFTECSHDQERDFATTSRMDDFVFPKSKEGI